MKGWVYVKRWQPFPRRWPRFLICVVVGHDTFRANKMEKHCSRCRKVWIRKGMFGT